MKSLEPRSPLLFGPRQIHQLLERAAHIHRHHLLAIRVSVVGQMQGARLPHDFGEGGEEMRFLGRQFARQTKYQYAKRSFTATNESHFVSRYPSSLTSCKVTTQPFARGTPLRCASGALSIPRLGQEVGCPPRQAERAGETDCGGNRIYPVFAERPAGRSSTPRLSSYDRRSIISGLDL